MRWRSRTASSRWRRASHCSRVSGGGASMTGTFRLDCSALRELIAYSGSRRQSGPRDPPHNLKSSRHGQLATGQGEARDPTNVD